MAASAGSFGSALLFGGGGFLGTTLVEQLLETGLWSSIVIASRDPKQTIPNVTYRKVDICDQQSVEALLADFKPRMVFHLVSPQYKSKPQTLYDSNITGTKNIIEACKQSLHVESLIYTSSNRVVANKPPCKLTEEEIIVLDESSKTHAYCKTKAMADTMALHANGPDLKTVVLRVPIVYGGRDQHMEIVMDFLDQGQQKTQLGDNNALFEIVSVQNAAHAHVLAAKALLSTAPAHNIAGHAFSITDDNPMRWYDFARKVWAEAGDNTPIESVKTVPFWALLAAASTWEWAVFLCTFGQMRATEFNWYNINTLKEGNCELDISKARELLGYTPIVSTEDGIKMATQRALRERKADKEAAAGSLDGKSKKKTDA